MGLPGYYLDVPGNLVTLPVAPRWGDPVDGAEVLDILLESGGGSRHAYTQATRAVRSFAFRFSRADKADFLLLHTTVIGRAIPFFFVPDTDDMDTFIYCRKEKDFKPKEVPSEAVIAGSVTSLFDYILELTAEPAVVEVGVLRAAGRATVSIDQDIAAFLTAEGIASGDLIGESTGAGVLSADGVASVALIGERIVEAVLAAAGAAAVSLASLAFVEGVLSSAGVAAVALIRAEGFYLKRHYSNASEGNVASFDVTGLLATEIFIVTRGYTLSVSGTITALASTDGGSTFRSTLGDYKLIAAAGTEADSSVLSEDHNTSATAARSGVMWISCVDSGYALTESRGGGNSRFFVQSTSPINAIRIKPNNGGNITGGDIYVYVKEF